MPKFILSAGKTPFIDDPENNSQIKQLLKQLGGFIISEFRDFDKLTDDYVLSYDDKWDIYKTLQRFTRIGGPISSPEAGMMVTKFLKDRGIFPCANTFNFNRTDVDNFFNLIDTKLRDTMPDPDVNQIGFRFYIGYHYEGPVSVVIVPMYGPKPDTTGNIDRTKEREKTFFYSAGVKFFGLLGIGKTDGTSSTMISDDDKFCFSKIGSKDNKGKQLAYHAETYLKDFISKLPGGTFETMRIVLARNNDDLVTIVVSFYDSNGRPLSSGGSADAYFFDQADLIPPPPPGFNVPDTYFPR